MSSANGANQWLEGGRRGATACGTLMMIKTLSLKFNERGSLRDFYMLCLLASSQQPPNAGTSIIFILMMIKLSETQ